MDTKEARERISSALVQARLDLESGVTPTLVADTLYDASVTASQVLSGSQPTPAEDATLLESLGRTMLQCGYAQLQANRDDTRKLDAILRSAKMVLGREPFSAEVRQILEDAYQDWHWHGH